MGIINILKVLLAIVGIVFPIGLILTYIIGFIITVIKQFYNVD